METSFCACFEKAVLITGNAISSGFRNCDKPRLIEALKTKRIRDIACGSSHSAALTSSGELYTWGLGEYGRLGHGDNTTQLKPKMVIMDIFVAYRAYQVLVSREDRLHV